MTYICSKCGHHLEPESPTSWLSIFTRKIEPLPLFADLARAEVTRCPMCGNVERTNHYRVFGVLTANQARFILLTVLALAVGASFWMVLK